MNLKRKLKSSKGKLLLLIKLLSVLLICGNLFAQSENITVIKGLVRDGAFNIAKEKIKNYLENSENRNESEKAEILNLYLDCLMATRDFSTMHTVSSQIKDEYCSVTNPALCFKAVLFDGYAYFFQEDYKKTDESLSFLEGFLKENKKNIPVDLLSQYYLLKGDLAFKRDKFKQAIDYYNSYLKLKFDNSVRLKLAVSYYHYKKFRKASSILLKLEKEGYSSPLLNRYLGLIYYGKEKYGIAFNYFSKNNDRQDRFFAVHTLVKMNKLEDAYRKFRELIPLPQITEEERAVFNLDIFIKKGELLSAESFIKKQSHIEDKRFFVLSFKVFDILHKYNSAVDNLRKYALMEDTHRDYFKLAEYYLTDLNDLENALLFYNKCIEKNPEGPFSSIALINRIKCTLYNGDKDKALKMLADFLDKYGETSPLTDEAYFIYGKLMLDRGNYEEAVKSFENILVNYPDSSLKGKALLYLGKSYFRNGMYADSIKLFEEKLENKNDETLSLLALSYYLTGDYSKATTYFEQADVKGYLKKLYVYSLAKSGKWDKALKIAEDKGDTPFFAMLFAGKNQDAYNYALKSEDPLLIYLSATLQQDTNLKKLFLQKALELADKDSTVRKLVILELEPIVSETGEFLIVMANEPEYVKNDPEDFHGVQGFLKKAEKYREKGNIAKAVYFYKMAVDNYPDAPGVDKAYYFLFESLRNPPVEYLNKIVEKFPESEYYSLANYKLGLIAFKNKEYSKAANYFETVLEHKNKSIEKLLFAIHYYLGVCYEKTGQVSKAVENYIAYLSSLPQDIKQIDERTRIAIFLQKNGKVEYALKEFQKLLSLARDEDAKAELTFYIAECYEKIGDLNKALENYLLVTYLHPKEIMWATTARFNAAKICEKLGYYDDAVKLYRKIAQAYKGQVQGEYAEKKLEELQKKVK